MLNYLFMSEFLHGRQIQLVMEFMASWSEPSKLMNPIVANTIAPEFRDKKVDFCMLDVDEFKVHTNIAQDLLLCLCTILAHMFKLATSSLHRGQLL